MKKFIALVLTLALAVSLCACSSKAGSQTVTFTVPMDDSTYTFTAPVDENGESATLPGGATIALAAEQASLDDGADTLLWKGIQTFAGNYGYTAENHTAADTSVEAAEAALRNHMKGKRLLPNLFRSENRISEVKGVYVPFWLFDADADAHIRYHATRIRTWSDRDYDYTETQHYAILRSGDLSFTHVPVDGSSRMPNDLMESIEPFDFSSAVDFQTAYLSGYLADRYDVNADDSIGRANERVKKSTESVFASTVVGYHTVVPESTSVRLANGRVRYALYPVWLLNTVWNGKTFSFAMNGQTGKFVGDLPVDKGKKWRWFGLVSGIAAAAAYGLVCLWQLLH